MNRALLLAIFFLLSGCYSTGLSTSSNTMSSRLQSTQNALAATHSVFNSALSTYSQLVDGTEISDSDISEANSSFKESQASANKLVSQIDGLLSLMDSASTGNYANMASTLESTKSQLSPTLSAMMSLLRQAINNTPAGTLYQSYMLLEGKTQLLSTFIKNAYSLLSSAYSYSYFVIEKRGVIEWA